MELIGSAAAGGKAMICRRCGVGGGGLGGCVRYVRRRFLARLALHLAQICDDISQLPVIEARIPAKRRHRQTEPAIRIVRATPALEEADELIVCAAGNER